MKNKFNNTILGIVSILTKDSNHNSDFDGPRMVDGVFTASDVSLKHYVRYILDKNGETVFYRKSLDKDGKILDIVDRCKQLNIKNKRDFFNCIDNKLFGHTILPDNKKSVKSTFNGPLQVTYGHNIFKENEYSTHMITGQFPSKTGKDSQEQATIGSQHKVDKANYIHEFKFFPKKLERDSIMKTDEFKDDVPYFDKNEVEKVKWAFSHCIGSSVEGSYISSSKSNTIVGLTVYVTLKEDTLSDFSLKNTIKCNEYNEYDLSLLYDKVEKNMDIIKSVDISYVDGNVKFIQGFPKSEIYNISDRGYEIKQ